MRGPSGAAPERRRAIIIVAADDSVMPQRKKIEAINHAAGRRRARWSYTPSKTKTYKPNDANPDHIKEQLSQMNYLVESWARKYQDQEVRAKKGLTSTNCSKGAARSRDARPEAHPNKKSD